MKGSLWRTLFVFSLRCCFCLPLQFTVQGTCFFPDSVLLYLSEAAHKERRSRPSLFIPPCVMSFSFSPKSSQSSS